MLPQLAAGRTHNTPLPNGPKIPIILPHSSGKNEHQYRLKMPRGNITARSVTVSSRIRLVPGHSALMMGTIGGRKALRPLTERRRYCLLNEPKICAQGASAGEYDHKNITSPSYEAFIFGCTDLRPMSGTGHSSPPSSKT